jgi:Leucine-rich repeat (LRR) protein
MRGCGIESIGFWAWSGLEKDLKSLDLSGNNLSDSSGLLFYNDSFNNLETLTRLHVNNIASGSSSSSGGRPSNALKLTPLSLLSSQYSLQDFSFKQNSLDAFDPGKFEMHFPNVRRLSLDSFLHRNRLTRSDLMGYGDYSLEDLSLWASDLEEISDGAFESSPSLKYLDLSNNRLRRVESNAFKSIGRSLLWLNLNSGLRTRTFPCESTVHHLHSLQFLNLMNNDLESLSNPNNCFENSTQLKVLALDFNSLKVLSPSLLKPLNELSFFSISWNKITTIESQTFNELDSMETIDLSYNHLTRIKSMSFANLRSLRHINLEGNDINTIEQESFYYLPKLEVLNLSFNQIKVVLLSFFDQIGTLSTFNLKLDHNEIASPPPPIDSLSSREESSSQTSSHEDSSHDKSHDTSFDVVSESSVSSMLFLPPQVNSIEVLDLSNNNLTSLLPLLDSIRNSLSQLLLNNNRLGNISSITSGLKHLQVLRLDSNHIQLIQADAFSNDFSLQILDVSNNLISDLMPDTFRDNTHLRILRMNRNFLRVFPQTLFRGMKNLDEIHASRNLVSYFPQSALTHVSKTLRILDLSFNQMRSLNLDDDNDDLRGRHQRNDPLRGSWSDDPEASLDITAEDISRRKNPSLVFPHLLFLDLSHNQIKSLSDYFFGSRFPQLQHLDLSFNPIRVVSDSLFDGLSYCLKNLLMSGCGFRSIPMLNLAELVSLNLSFNSISAPNSISLTNITQLEDFDVSNNRLNIVPNNLWSQLNKLKKLDISSNPIQVINEESFLGLDQLESLTMHNLTRVSSIAIKALYPLFSLNDLKISSYSWIKKFSISLFVEEMTSLKRLEIVMDSGEGEVFRSDILTKATLPVKLSTLKIIGSHKMTRIPADAFSKVRSYSLDLSIEGTNISWIEVESIGEAKVLSLDIRDNELTSLPDLLPLTPSTKRRVAGAKKSRVSKTKRKQTDLHD